MKIVRAFVEMKAAILGIRGEDFIAAVPQLTLDGVMAMRQLGFTTAEIEDGEFPDSIVIEGLGLIANDPDEFNRRTKEAGDLFRARN